jgi:hypothetical protein
MWWHDESTWVTERMPVLLAAWRNGELPFVTAIGSTWTETGERTVFVGVEPNLDPRPWTWAPSEGLLDRLTRALIRRCGPLPFAGLPPVTDEDRGVGGLPVVTRRVTLPRAMNAVTSLLAIRRRLHGEDLIDLLMVPLDQADAQTRDRLTRFELPAVTRVGYVGRIRPLSKNGKSVFRRASGQRATVGCLLRTPRGSFLTTAGHLGVEKGEPVHRRLRARLVGWKWSPWGTIAAVTSPEHPDPLSVCADGLDIAAVATDEDGHDEIWHPVTVGDPRSLRRGEYVRWNGGVSGPHEGSLAVTAAGAEAMSDQLEYGHALMVVGNPPGWGGKQGDSGSAMYDSRGGLLGHLVGIEGGRLRGTAPTAWFQMIDIAHPYLEEQCGPISDYYGDHGT